MSKNKSHKGWWTVGIVAAIAFGASANGGASVTTTAPKTQLSAHMKAIRFCESSDDYHAVSKIHAAAGGYASGAFQFVDSTWAEYHTGYKHAGDAPQALQDEIAVKHQAKYGDGPWAESRKCWRNR